MIYELTRSTVDMPISEEERRRNAAMKLLGTAHQRATELATSLPKYNESMEQDSDAEEGKDVEAPILESMYLVEGQAGLVTLTNFLSDKFEELWVMIKTHVEANWNVGRGRKSPHKPKDVFMMALSVLKRGKPWDVVAQSYNMAAPVFEKLVGGFVEVVSGYLYALLVETVPKDWPMERMKADGKVFENFPCVLYAVDVQFQQTNHPSGNHLESKPFFSGKHNLYGVKTEVAVNSVGLVVHSTKYKKGSVADKTILMEHLQTHLTLCKKTTNGRLLEDNGPQVEKYPNYWSMIADKGYQGIQEACRIVLPKKKPRNGTLTLEDKLGNKMVASDRIIVKNFFGRLCSLWGLMHKKFRWNLDKYDSFNQLAIALTNLHVMKYPLPPP